MAIKKTYESRKNRGLCVRCCKPSPNQIVCLSCRAKDKKKKQVREEQGLCIQCRTPAVDGTQRCARCLQKNKEKCRRYYRKHTDRVKEYSRQWRIIWTKNTPIEKRRERFSKHNTSEKGRATKKRWANKNYLRVKESSKRRIHRLRSARGDYTIEQKNARFALWGNRCYYCDNRATEIDHSIPLSLGGTNWPANLRPCCRKCNARKGRIMAQEFKNIIRIHSEEATPAWANGVIDIPEGK